jgi:hypothetical protein
MTSGDRQVPTEGSGCDSYDGRSIVGFRADIDMSESSKLVECEDLEIISLIFRGCVLYPAVQSKYTGKGSKPVMCKRNKRQVATVALHQCLQGTGRTQDDGTHLG